MTELLTKGEFAKRRGVTPAAVSQWLSTGRLTGSALVGIGRNAKIDVAEAERQLGLTLDPGQQMARGGRPVASGMPPAGGGDAPSNNAVERYQLARAINAEIETERARRKEEAERGNYMETAPARDAWSKELSGFIQAVDMWFPDVAELLAAETTQGVVLDAKAITVHLRRSWRSFRAKRSDLAASARDAAPALIAPAEPNED